MRFPLAFCTPPSKASVINLTRIQNTFGAFEFQLKENTDAIVRIAESMDANTTVLKGVKEDVDKLKSQVTHLQKENELLKQKCVEHD